MERQYILSERAHLMCPHMHFGILLTLDGAYDRERATRCLDALAAVRPFLRARVAWEEARPYYAIGDASAVEARECSTADELRATYRALAERGWDVSASGLLRVFFLPMNNGFQALFAAHHLLADGRGLLELCARFAELYAGEAAPPLAEERLIRGMDDLPAGSALRGMSRLLVRRANSAWRKEAHAVTYEEYARFEAAFDAENPVAYELCAPPAERLEALLRLCKDGGVSVNDYLMAKAYLAFGTQKLVIAADIRDRLPRWQPGALGNYATAMGVVCRGRETDALAKAKAVRALVERQRSNPRSLMLVLACYLTMDGGLIDAAAIASLGGFESKAGRFVGQSMFGFLKRDGVSLTNLGRLENAHIREAVFIPPASPAVQTTVGALTVNGQLRLCASFAEKSVDRASVRRALEEMTGI